VTTRFAVADLHGWPVDLTLNLEAIPDPLPDGAPARPTARVRLLGTARGAAAEPLLPFRQLSDVLDGRVRPGQPVLPPGEVLLPVVALMERGDALVLPTCPEYGPAVPRPVALAASVARAPAGPDRGLPTAQDAGWTDRLRDDVLLTDVRGVRVDVLRGADRQPGSVSV
jgi:hypothetical protein